MAKRKDHTITAQDLREYLATRDDFALELFVYQKAGEFGFTASHGGTYTDPVTKKPRQFDVRASIHRGDCRIDLAIECKSLQPSYPLLLSRIPRALAENFHQILFYDIEVGSQARPIPSSLNVLPVILRDRESIYHTGHMVAKTMTQVGRDAQKNLTSGDDGVYDKWSQALASADEFVTLAEGGHNRKKLWTFILPILVVSDGTLWVADYAADGHPVKDPREVEESELFVGRHYKGPMGALYTISHLHILTKGRIASFFERIVKDGDFWQQIFPSRYKA